MRRSVGRPRDGNPAETKRQILMAAQESFAESGFCGATTRQVASRAGVNVATLHYHFRNKEGLYWAVLGEALKGELPQPAPGASRDGMSRVVEGLYDFGAARPALSRLSLLHVLAGPGATDESAAGAPDPRVGILARSLAGSPGPGSPEATARSIVNLIDAALVSQLRENGGGPGHEVARTSVVAAALRLAGV